MNAVWVVTMRRWGDPELHSYVTGVCDSEAAAKKLGESQRDYRGGKYEADITRHEIIFMEDLNDSQP